jgi:predicted nucleic acid-binding protein
MKTSDLVLVDTCVWVPFFNRPNSSFKAVVDQLLDDNRAAIIGPVLAEILRGFHRDAEADWVASLLRGLCYLEVRWDDWRTAASLGRYLAASGHLLPLTDLALAAVARRSDCAVFTTDPHFDLLPDLKRFTVPQ